MGIESDIENCHLLTAIFGRFPSFHDAEVLSLRLERGDYSPSLEAMLYLFEMAREVDDEGLYAHKNRVAVRFRFDGIANLSLADFNGQNVLQYLEVARLSGDGEHELKFRIVLQGIFGVTARFDCASVRVEAVEPYDEREPS